jgi:hypothetical protein
LRQRIQELAPDVRLAGADYWHFVKLRQRLDGEARQRLSA